MVGWVTQMIFGVIYWMFPIITRAQPRGNERLGWAVYILLNVGLLLRVIYEPWNWLPVHIELLLFGWVVQLTMGVAFWIMPRYWKKPRRGNTKGAYLALVLLNAGIWMVALTPVLWLDPRVSVTGRLLETGAVITFAHAIFPRVVGREG